MSSKKKSRNRKGEDVLKHSVPQTDEFNPDFLPRRLYATDRYPPAGRINCYSHPEYLLDLVDALDGTEEFNYLKDSCFGPLFDLPTRKSSISGKLVHQLLCRTLVTEKKYEIWFIFAGQPFWFSLREFGILTGLPCGAYPDVGTIRGWLDAAESDNPYWDTLISKTESIVSIKEIVHWLKVDKRKPVKERMPAWRRIRLALVVIVEGILICNKQPVRASKEIVEMVKDLKAFEQYPWGRESFLLTLRMVTVSKKCTSLEELIFKLNQSHTATHGFPLALQLLIFKAIPQFEKYLPDPDDDRTFTDRSIISLIPLKTFHNSNIMRTDTSFGIKIDPYLQSEDRLYENVNEWADEVEDPSVLYMERLISSGFKFSKEIWRGGVRTWPVIVDSSKPINSKKPTHPSKPTQPSKSRQSSGDIDSAIKDYIDKKLADHTQEMQCLVSVERDVYRDHLIDEIISELRLGQRVIQNNRSLSVDRKTPAMVDKTHTDKSGSAVRESFVDLCNKQSALAEGKTSWANYPGVSGIVNDVVLMHGGNSSSTEEEQESGSESDEGEDRGITAAAKFKAVDVNKDKTAVMDQIGQQPVSQHPSMDKYVDGSSTVDKTDPDSSTGVKTAEATDFSNEVSLSAGLSSPKDSFQSANISLNQSARISTTPNAPLVGVTSPPLPFGQMQQDILLDPQPGMTSALDKGPGADDNTLVELIKEHRSQELSLGDHNQESLEDGQGQESSQDGHDQELSQEGQDEELSHDGQDDKSSHDGHDEESSPDGHNSSAEDNSGTDHSAKEDYGATSPSKGLFKRNKAQVHGDQPNENPPKRQRRMPKRFRDSSNKKKPAPQLEEDVDEYLDPFAVVDPVLAKKFISKLASDRRKEYIVDGRQHIEALLALLWRKFGESLLHTETAILDTWFTQTLCSEFARFRKFKKKGSWSWNSLVKNYVRGFVSGRPNRMAWFTDVDTIYAPMNWGKDHWVSLVIDLRGHVIRVLDPDICANDEKKLLKTMKPVSDILPLLITELIPGDIFDNCYPTAFEVERVVDVSQNNRAGDFGPLSVKFVELHAQGFDLLGISNEMVDNIRMKYAIDLYEEFIQSL